MSLVGKLVRNALGGIRGAAQAMGARGDTKHPQAWGDYGYPEWVSFEQLYAMQQRFGLAKAGVRKPVVECWRTDPQIIQGDGRDVDNRDPTPFEIEFDSFARNFKLWERCRAGDMRQRVGQYGGLLVQIRGNADQIAWEKPLGMVRQTQIVKFIPFYEGQMIPATWDTDSNSIRYGLPTTYNFQENFIGNAGQQRQRNMEVHYSRVIIFAEGADDDSIFGEPCNESGFNSLLTLEKLIGAGGEGFWKNAAQKLVFIDNTDDTIAPDAEEQDKIDEAIKAFAENLEKQLQIGGMDVKPLNTTLIDVMPFFEVALNDYAASVDIPSKILIGAQTGRLAADEDGNAYLRGMMSRRQNVCTKFINDVIEWLFEHGVFNRTEYMVWWDDLLAPAESDKLALANKMADVNHKMTLHGLVFTPDEVRQVAGYVQKIAEVAPEPDPLDEGMGEGDEEQDLEQEGLGGQGGQGLSTTEPQRGE